MKVLNNTHYWHLHSKLYNEVPDTNSFVYQSSKRHSFYLRMYYEYQYTLQHGGKAFFVTFTYNDKSIPKYLGYPVFNYEHIRLITNGVISKRLYRAYGCSMKYLCACEAGEGGTAEHHKRGLGNNPHYHFIFFVIPVIKGTPCIDSKKFFSICQEVWQGKSGYIPWQKARFGSVKEGKFGIEVLDTRAFKYVGKYCLKDNHTLFIENSVHDLIYQKCLSQEYSLSNFRRYLWYLNSIDPKHPFTISAFARLFDLPAYNMLRKRDHIDINYFINHYCLDYLPSSDPHFIPFVRSNFIKYHTFFLENILPDLVASEWNKFKLKYSGKCRSSKSLGISGLDYVINPDSDPHFKIVEPSGPKIYKLPLYYLRHIYYDVVTCPVTGNPLYVLNRRGHDLKLVRLNKSVSDFYNFTLRNVSTLIDNKLSFFYRNEKYDVIASAMSLRLSFDYLKTVYIYSVYNIVYKYRIYSKSSALALSDDFNFAQILEDYDNFLQTDRFKLDFEEGTIYNLFARDPSACLFNTHYLFHPYSEIFNFLDSINEHVSSVISDKKKSQFEFIAEQNRKYNAYEHSQSL